MSPSALGALLRDLAERAVRAFVAAFLAVVVAGALNVVSVSSGRALVVAAFGAGVSAVVSLFAGVTGTRGSASLNPANRGGLR
jgi:hypothetical protein